MPSWWYPNVRFMARCSGLGKDWPVLVREVQEHLRLMCRTSVEATRLFASRTDHRERRLRVQLPCRNQTPNVSWGSWSDLARGGNCARVNSGSGVFCQSPIVARLDGSAT